MAESHQVSAQADGERLDKFLASLPSVGSRRRARDAIDSGKVSLDGRELGPADRGTPLRAGSSLTIDWNRPGTARAARKGKQELHRLGIRIVHEDDHIVVVDKPPGLLTDSATHQQARTEESVRSMLNGRLRSRGEKAWMVHRIDRDTSGLVVVARNEQAFEHLRAQFSQHRPLRQYWALVSGGPRAESGHWAHPMRWDSTIRLQLSARDDDREAVVARAAYKVLKRFGRRATVLEITLDTGRRNQIRLHCRLQGCPLVGERQYLDPNAERSPLPAPRQALHAWRLGFVHPGDGRSVHYECPLPQDLTRLLRGLSGKAGDSGSTTGSR